MKGRLANEASPYLRQHANNPVEWFPWCEEAFEKARKENKIVFLSIGYSSCHWCHVMEKEVFENEEIAEFLNRNFVSIKVDKEERPDIDKYYQEAYRLLNQKAGGWPLSIFMTPQKEPFFAGTYIPPQPKYDMVGFLQLIKNIHEIWSKNPKEIINHAKGLGKYLNSLQNPKKAVRFDKNIIKKFIDSVKNIYDQKNGGFGDKPKFPQTSIINTLLKIAQLTGDQEAKQMALSTLKNMAKGGLRDLVDGGFCRYSVDEKWFVPHFEKMTYDNALLAESYLEAYLVTKEKEFKKIAFETLDFMGEKMLNDSLYFSSSDADSEGREGGYFLFDYEEIKEKLLQDGFNQKEIDEILKRLGVSKKGNFEGKNILRIEEDFKNSDKIIKSLKELRSKKSYPFIDRKIITSWNAMMIASLYKASRIDARYFEAAEESLKTLLQKMYINERLYHVTIDDRKPDVEAFLEDYAYLIRALLEGYKSTLNEEYLAMGVKLTNDALVEFWEEGRWYFSKKEIRTESDHTDATYPSSAAIMVSNMLSLGSLFEEKYRRFAYLTIEFYSEKIYRHLPYCASFVEDIIRFLFEDMIIKGDEGDLVECIGKIDFYYPFILLKSEKGSQLQLCSRSKCFEHQKGCESILKRIEELK